MSKSRGQPGRRNAFEYELSAAIVVLKDHFKELVSGESVRIGSDAIDTIKQRARSSDSAVRRYVGAKLYQAYLGHTSDLTLTFTTRDLDYLGISVEDFQRAVSLADKQDWDVRALSIQPRKSFLQHMDSEAGETEAGGIESAGVTAGTGDRRTVFICHAEADKIIATAFKNYFEKADLPMEVFAASHPASLPGGHEWWQEIRDALLRAPVVLTLVSPRSKDRPWLHFESGGAYFKGKLVIPLAVPPERKSLPPPLGVLQARDLAIKEDVAAVVKEVGQALKVTFVGSSDELWAVLRDASARLNESSTGPLEGTRESAPPWERQLRSLAERGTTVQVHPIVPPAFDSDVFEIGPIDDMTIGLIKQDSRHRIDIPPNRVIGIRKAGDAYVLDIRGRVQWTDAKDVWLYMPEDTDAKDPNGLAREIHLQAEEAQHLDKRLKDAGWTTGFATELKARGQLSKSYQLVYGADGRYLRVSDRVAPLVMIKRRGGA